MMTDKIKMMLCPNCRTIQRGGTACTTCKCPIPEDFYVAEPVLHQSDSLVKISLDAEKFIANNMLAEEFTHVMKLVEDMLFGIGDATVELDAGIDDETPLLVLEVDVSIKSLSEWISIRKSLFRDMRSSGCDKIANLLVVVRK